jgi:hypothetical protein
MKMLTFDAFINKYIGRSPDWDGSGSAQCVDLAKAGLKEVHGVKPFSVVSAKNYFLKYTDYKELVDKFERIENTREFVPMKGDMAVWDSTKGGGHGHVAWCSGEGNTKYFYSYDMNWNGKTMKKVKHDYKGFLGVLRPRDYDTVKSEYFQKCNSEETSLVDALRSIGAKSDFAYRKVIASENNISGYIGTAKQNTAMLKLLKDGKLIKP